MFARFFRRGFGGGSGNGATETIPVYSPWRPVEHDAGLGEWPQYRQKALGQALNARNVAFLLGAGCSSLEIDGKQRGIPTMAPLAAEFCKHPLPPQFDDDFNLITPPPWGLTSDDLEFLNANGASLNETEYTWNLERLMELLFSLAFIYRRSDKASHSVSLKPSKASSTR